MSSHVYHELYAHLVWHTKCSLPMLSPQLESEVHEYLRNRCRSLGGVFFHGIGGTETHVHLAINYEPHWSISEIIKDLKGSSAHEINKSRTDKILQWQRGYGVVSFGSRNLDVVQEYIQNQKINHGQGKLHTRLERFSDDEGDYVDKYAEYAEYVVKE